MKALSVDAGVCGPVAAMALQRAGIDTTVYEARPPTADSVGSYLTVAINGLDALRAIGAERRVIAAGFPTPEMVMFSGTGKRLGTVPLGGTLADGTVSHTIRRALLHKAVRLRDLMLPIVFRYVITEKSMAWMYDHHVEWDRPIAAGGA
jgi:2-polyprenyl-6-methoxyphenol hydroxylase-like FAD-dependent oxidoreductase